MCRTVVSPHRPTHDAIDRRKRERLSEKGSEPGGEPAVPDGVREEGHRIGASASSGRSLWYANGGRARRTSAAGLPSFLHGGYPPVERTLFLAAVSRAAVWPRRPATGDDHKGAPPPPPPQG